MNGYPSWLNAVCITESIIIRDKIIMMIQIKEARIITMRISSENFSFSKKYILRQDLIDVTETLGSL